MRLITGGVAGLVPLVALAIWAAPGGSTAPRAVAVECAVVSVRATTPDGPSTLVTVDPATGAVRSPRLLDRRINALGRDDTPLITAKRAATHRNPGPLVHDQRGRGAGVYGIGQRKGERAQFVRLGPRGEITVLGPARGLGDVFVGAVHGGVWYLLSRDTLVTVKVDGLARSAPRRLSRPLSIGDWDYDPHRGALLALASNQLVAVDPHSGAVTVVATPRGLPPGDYGAIWLDHRSRALFGLNNRSGATYRVPLAGPPVATLASAGSPVTAADAAGCPPSAPSHSASPSPSVVRPEPSPASPPPSASAPVAVPSPEPPSPQPLVAVAGPPRMRPPRVRPPGAQPVRVAPPRAMPPQVAPLGVRPQRRQVKPQPPVAGRPTDPVAVTAQRHADKRERSRRRVAAAAAILTLGGMLARGRARGR